MRRFCDVPGCDGSRSKWQRLCDPCFRRLPGEIRVGLAEAHHQRRMADWRRLRTRAAAFLGLDRPAAPSATPQAAYANAARLLGERE